MTGLQQIKDTSAKAWAKRKPVKGTTRMFSPTVMERKLLVVDPAGVVNQIKKVRSLLTTRIDHQRYAIVASTNLNTNPCIFIYRLETRRDFDTSIEDILCLIEKKKYFCCEWAKSFWVKYIWKKYSTCANL